MQVNELWCRHKFTLSRCILLTILFDWLVRSLGQRSAMADGTLVSLLFHPCVTLASPLRHPCVTLASPLRHFTFIAWRQCHLSGSTLAVVRQLSSSTSAVVRQYLAVVRQYFGSFPAVHLCHPKVIVFVVSPYCDWWVVLLWQRAVGLGSGRVVGFNDHCYDVPSQICISRASVDFIRP